MKPSSASQASLYVLAGVGAFTIVGFAALMRAADRWEQRELHERTVKALERNTKVLEVLDPKRPRAIETVG